MSSKVLPEALHRALRSEDSAAFLLEVEDKLIALIALCRSKASSELSATEKQISFPAFDTFKRQCVHHIAARYKLTTASVGEGFDRHVVVTFNPDCELPDESLRDIYAATSKSSSSSGARKPRPREPASASGASAEPSSVDDKSKLASAISAALHSGGSRSDPVDSVTAIMEAVSLKAPYDPMKEERSYDHVVEVRSVAPSMTMAALEETIAAKLKPETVPIQDISRYDDNTAIIVCSNQEGAQKVLSTFSHPILRVCVVSTRIIRDIGSTWAPPVRPQTTRAVANRLIMSALGGRSGIRRAQAEMQAIVESSSKPKPPPEIVIVPAASAKKPDGIEGDWRSSKHAPEPEAPQRAVKGRGAIKFDRGGGGRRY